MRTRRLTLDRETLTELSADELAAVAAGAETLGPLGCEIYLTNGRECDSWFRPCITYTCTR